MQSSRQCLCSAGKLEAAEMLRAKLKQLIVLQLDFECVQVCASGFSIERCGRSLQVC